MVKWLFLMKLTKYYVIAIYTSTLLTQNLIYIHGQNGIFSFARLMGKKSRMNGACDVNDVILYNTC